MANSSLSWPYNDHWLFDTVTHGWGRYFQVRDLTSNYFMPFFALKKEVFAA